MTRLVRIAPWAMLSALSVFLLILAVTGSVTFQSDFNGDVYLAGSKILHGRTPYQHRVLAQEAAIVRAGGTVVGSPTPRYPATALVALAPLSLLPEWVADLLFLGVGLAAVIGALLLLEVRDWRCIGVACFSWPVVFAVWLGNITTLVLLGGALVWRWRARIWPAAATFASVVVAKLFLWPLGIWFLATRRFRAITLAALLATVAGGAGWAVVGWGELAKYPRLLGDVVVVGEGRGSSLVATLMSLGASATSARIVTMVCAAGLMATAWRLVRLPDGDRRAFGVIVVAALVATPVAWAHYLILAFIPIALMSPGLSWLWFLPMLAALAPPRTPHPFLWTSLPQLAIELVLLVNLYRPLWSSRRAPEPAPA